jgi:hypothetical protein
MILIRAENGRAPWHTTHSTPLRMSSGTMSARQFGRADIFEAAGRRSFAPFAVRDHHRAG